MPWRRAWRNIAKVRLGELLQAHLSMQAAIDSLTDPVVIFSVAGDLQNAIMRRKPCSGSSRKGARMSRFKSVDAATRAVLERMRSHVLSGKGAFNPRGFEDAVQLPTLLGDRYFLPRASAGL